MRLFMWDCQILCAVCGNRSELITGRWFAGIKSPSHIHDRPWLLKDPFDASLLVELVLLSQIPNSK